MVTLGDILHIPMIPIVLNAQEPMVLPSGKEERMSK